MGVACQILIDRKKEGVYKTGQSVTGLLKYALDTPTQYKAVILSFLGTGNCSWRESLPDNETKRYSGSEDLITVHNNLVYKKTKKPTSDIGSYAFRFKFQLPEDLPSSFKDSNSHISYRIRAQFIKPGFFSFNRTFITEIPVYGSVKPTVEEPVTFCLEKTLLQLFSTEKSVINLKAEMAKTFYAPGENMQLSLQVANNTEVVPSVWAELICYVTYTSDCKESVTSGVRIKGCSSKSANIPKRSVANISQTIPTHPQLHSISCKVVKKEYKLRVTVRLPFPHLNDYLEIPVAIGQRKGINVAKSDEEDEALRGDTLELGQEAVEDVPPSYWEAMCEEKLKITGNDAK